MRLSCIGRPTAGPALDVRLERESIWLTQAQMVELFGVNVPAVFKHIKNIYATGELESGATVSKMKIVRQEGSRKVRRVVVVNLINRRNP